MSHSRITASHRSRTAVIYVRQSTLSQVERNRESTARQYDLVERAVALGWPRSAVRVVDGDLGVSGSVTGHRDGFDALVAEVALGQVGIILALEASRLARDNAAWYRLLDLAGACDTLVADADGVYHPALFNDRLVLGMKGIMSEAELHVLRARLDGGIRNKAARGELRRGLPVGLVWGEDDGQILLPPRRGRPRRDRRGVRPVHAVFRPPGPVWLWLRDQGLRWPLQQIGYRRGVLPEITWVEPTYHAVHTTLTHPAYAGAYVFGRSRTERCLAEDGTLKARRRRLPRDQWEVCLPGHHPGFIDWDTYQANQARLAANTRPPRARPRHRGGARGLRPAAGPGHLRDLRPQARRLLRRADSKSTPGYYCASGDICNGRGVRHLRVGGVAIDAAVTAAFLAAITPAAAEATLAAAEHLETGHRAALDRAAPAARAGPLRRRPGRTPLPRGRCRQPSGRPQPRSRLEHRAERRRHRRSRPGPRPAAPPHPADRHRTGRRPGPGPEPAPGLDSALDPRQGPQATAAHPAGRGRHQPDPRHQQRPRRPGPALEGRRHHRPDDPDQTQATEDPHRRRHRRPGPPAGPALPRRRHRRDPQPPAPKHPAGTVVHRQ